MDSWLFITIVVVALFVGAAFRERWRLKGIESFCRSRNLRSSIPIDEVKRIPVKAIVKRFHPDGGRNWGVVIEGTLGSGQLLIAEHETSGGAGKTGIWRTVVIWEDRNADGPIVIWPEMGSMPLSDMRIKERLNCDLSNSPPERTIEHGFLVEGMVQGGWLSSDKAILIKKWKHGGEFLRDNGYCAWRLKGLLTPKRLAELYAQIPTAQHLLS